jgi:acylphosphatase
MDRALNVSNIMKGYIFLPYSAQKMDLNSQDGLDYRTSIIMQCKRKKTVSLLFDNGSYANNCPISLQALQDVEWPEKFGSVGSTVLCHVTGLHKKPMIFAVFGKQNDVVFDKEGDKKLSSIFVDSHAEVGVKGKTGEIFLNVDSAEATGGNIWVNITNADATGTLNIRVKGTSNIYTSGVCSISSDTQVQTIVTDSENKITGTVSVTKDGTVDITSVDSENKITGTVSVTKDGTVDITSVNSSGTTEFKQTVNGFTLVKASSGLKNTLKNVLNELIAFKTVSPGGEGLTDPSTITNLQKYLTDLDNYLEA